MISKFILLAAVVAVARAAFIYTPSGIIPLAHPSQAIIGNEPLDSQPNYSFNYHVDDGLTGDNKAHKETRYGDVVQGSYSLIEPDGTRRTVAYTADPINGFNAVQHKDPSVSVKTAIAAAPALASTIHQGQAQA
ncbi:cuticular protein RR-2 family member 48 precursor [Nasonia vitripennis]|uniref:Uncharacterized protein n=1 Tax=Nasonia vitripennis TaxID=7425 RepID=A0A7M6UDT1_NASVI|nr:cuticular protein RR-2 family member 48 precursor [Nasonia vitripennis]